LAMLVVRTESELRTALSIGISEIIIAGELARKLRRAEKMSPSGKHGLTSGQGWLLLFFAIVLVVLGFSICRAIYNGYDIELAAECEIDGIKVAGATKLTKKVT